MGNVFNEIKSFKNELPMQFSSEDKYPYTMSDDRGVQKIIKEMMR